MLDNFINHLPEKVRCTDNFDDGITFKKKEKALNHRYIALNQLYRKYIAVDIDKPESAFLWEDLGLPAPTIITINPINSHCHCLWEIKVPIIYTDKGRLRPQKWLEAIDASITSILGADVSYGGLMTKTPNHPSWKTIIHKNVSYELGDFEEYFDVKPSRKVAIEPHEKGRNNTLFTTVYKHGRKIAFKFNSEESLMNELVTYGESVNQEFLGIYGSVLPYKEVLNTSRSAARRAWRLRNSKFDDKNRGVLADQIDESMSLKERRVLGAEYTNTVRTEKLDDKIKAAIYKCKERGLPFTTGNLEKFGLSRSTFSKHKESVENWIRILTT